MPNEYVPRLSIEITEEAFQRMTNRIPWGLRSKVMAMLLDDLLDLVEEHGEIVIAAILERSIATRNILKGLPKEVRSATK
jgi:hypothetical protein